MSKYFAPKEFQACVPSCSIEQMEPGFLELLDRVREAAGIPLVLNCAFRSVAHEKQMGRSGNSAHTRGRAVDPPWNAVSGASGSAGPSFTWITMTPSRKG